MKLSTYQPYFAPFPGFFFKAHLSDIMVILDDVQFPQRTTWITRNRFKNDRGTLWITVPVWRKGLGLQRINSVKICPEGNWRKKGLRSLKTSYTNSPFLKEHRDFLADIFSEKYKMLIDLNMKIIQYIKGYLGLTTPIILQSETGIKDKKGNELLIELCLKMGATQYLAQRNAKKYLDKGLFSGAGIKLEYFDPPSPVYPQLWGNFIHNLSTLDLLLNCGPGARDVLLQPDTQ